MKALKLNGPKKGPNDVIDSRTSLTRNVSSSLKKKVTLVEGSRNMLLTQKAQDQPWHSPP